MRIPLLGGENGKKRCPNALISSTGFPGASVMFWYGMYLEAIISSINAASLSDIFGNGFNIPKIGSISLELTDLLSSDSENEKEPFAGMVRLSFTSDRESCEAT